jgi:hypothetical protein
MLVPLRHFAKIDVESDDDADAETHFTPRAVSASPSLARGFQRSPAGMTSLGRQNSGIRWPFNGRMLPSLCDVIVAPVSGTDGRRMTQTHKHTHTHTHRYILPPKKNNKKRDRWKEDDTNSSYRIYGETDTDKDPRVPVPGALVQGK